MARLATTLALISALVGGSAFAQDAPQDEADAALSSTVDDSPDMVEAAPVAALRHASRVACIISMESHGDPNAYNRRSGAAGLGQFLSGTWLTTPQGKAGRSVYDPDANRAAIDWMIDAGRATEFDAVRYYGC